MTGSGDEGLAQCQRHRLCPVVNSELAQDALDMGADRGAAHHEPACHLGLVVAGGQQPEHLELAVGELVRVMQTVPAG